MIALDRSDRDRRRHAMVAANNGRLRLITPNSRVSRCMRRPEGSTASSSTSRLLDADRRGRPRLLVQRNGPLDMRMSARAFRRRIVVKPCESLRSHPHLRFLGEEKTIRPIARAIENAVRQTVRDDTRPRRDDRGGHAAQGQGQDPSGDACVPGAARSSSTDELGELANALLPPRRC